MSGFSDPILAGDNSLIRSSAKSPNYAAGSAGWSIKKDGSAEFSNVIIRGGQTSQSTILIYNGSPAAGNLIASIAPAGGTDSFGNGYPQGIGAESGTQLIQLQGNAAGSPAVSVNPDTGHYQPGQVYGIVGGGQPQLGLSSPFPNGGTVAASAASIVLGGKSIDGTITPAITVKPYLQATQPGTQTPATWQTPVLGTGWATGPGSGTVQPLQYRLDAEDNLVIVGSVHSTAVPAATMFTLPVGYRPAITQRIPVVENKGGTMTLHAVEINSSGAVALSPNLAASGSDIYIQAVLPMGNIS